VQFGRKRDGSQYVPQGSHILYIYILYIYIYIYIILYIIYILYNIYIIYIYIYIYISRPGVCVHQIQCVPFILAGIHDRGTMEPCDVHVTINN